MALLISSTFQSLSRVRRSIAAALQGLRFRATLTRYLRRYARPPEKAEKVLIWDLGNFPGIIARNGLFATALKLRGQCTHTILCDGTPLACIQRGIEKPEAFDEWSSVCSGCSKAARRVAEKYCLDFSMVGDYVSQVVRDEFKRLADSLPVQQIAQHVYLGANVGAMAWSSLNRHMKGVLVEMSDMSKKDETIYRAYLYAALINVHAASRTIDAHSPASVVTSHGIYVDYAPPMSIAYQRGLAAVSWSSAYAQGHHYFTVPKGANQLLLQGVSRKELWEERAATALTAGEERQLEEFLHHRYFRAGARDIKVISEPEERETLRTKIGLPAGKPIFCVFTHVNWDACFDMSSMIYANANVWVIDTIKRAISNKDINWIIRVHPGELTDGSVLSTGDVIKAEFPELPGHIRVLQADSDINSYGLYRLIDGGVTIFGTAGVELAAMGKPVILAGQAHYGNKGFTFDAGSQAEYVALLDHAAKHAPLSPEQTAVARRYAYWYFVERHIPIRSIDLKQGHWGDLDLDRLESLLPGHDPIMDVVCRDIVEGRDFILPRETLPQTDA